MDYNIEIVYICSQSLVATKVSVMKNLSRNSRNTAKLLSFYPFKLEFLNKEDPGSSIDQLFLQEEKPLQVFALAKFFLWKVLFKSNCRNYS